VKKREESNPERRDDRSEEASIGSEPGRRRGKKEKGGDEGRGLEYVKLKSIIATGGKKQ